MRLASLLGPDLQALKADPEALQAAFDEFHPEDVAELLEDLPIEQVADLVHALSSEAGADVIERLSPERQRVVLEAVDEERATELLTAMDPDDRVDFFEELEEDEVEAYLGRLDKEIVEETQELLAYDPETAGGLMTTEYVGLRPDMKVWEAVEEVRKIANEGEAETIYYLYVVGYGEKLLGVVSLRDLILSDPGQELADIMTEKVVWARPTDDQEDVAQKIARYDLAALPVVDDQDGMLGVVTVDDVVDVVIEEATEDAQMMGGVVPLEDAYFSTGLLEFVWKRGAWLIVLFLGQLLTATVMEQNQSTLRATMELAVFIPLIIASGGNAGSQSSTLIIRAMAVGEAQPGDWLKVFGREMVIGLALGLILGLMGFGRGWFAGETVDATALGIAVGMSILAIVTLSTIIGSLLPMLIQRAGLDPAVSSTPFIASVVDVLGLIVYFSVAQVILGMWV
ncbi:MAG TPA: magnesium transporter [Polyangiaceae bacterium LLY-WYZ-15_(1-7)]|nr:magnesium transporter [Myxococcales bacterium]MBJ74582.1 magnesium transporter [Sandaracinus sp.]HJK92296.1 magnesium transporter [Polyangiaceae bacterium LLY-WYZ-15_(1-7)]HJL02953.1 magnesium transporter [Polyangiaceae bacterium LLY-WYZ-15_(1-7)]HJL13659.1 magnesium transporter [Polyangiaceae bacterium LLY-WYZ-15_(1-7)]